MVVSWVNPNKSIYGFHLYVWFRVYSMVITWVNLIYIYTYV